MEGLCFLSCFGCFCFLFCGHRVLCPSCWAFCICLVILGVPFTVKPTGRSVLQAGVLIGEPVGAVFYWGNAGSLIVHWVEEVDSLLPAARMWGGESRGGHSASALASPVCPGHSPTHSAPHRVSLRSCPEGGIRQESGTGRIGTGRGAWRLSSPLSSWHPVLSCWSLSGSPHQPLGSRLSWPVSQVRKPLATKLPLMLPVWVQMFKHLKFF